jgi:hypothetical protein
MANDSDLVKSFEAQINVLTAMQDGITTAIKTANGQLEELRAGKSVQDVFGPGSSKQGSAAQSQGGKDHPR